MKKMMAQEEFEVLQRLISYERSQRESADYVSEPAMRFVRASAVNSVIGIFFPSPSTAARRCERMSLRSPEPAASRALTRLRAICRQAGQYSTTESTMMQCSLERARRRKQPVMRRALKRWRTEGKIPKRR